MIDSIYHMTPRTTLKLITFLRENAKDFAIYKQPSLHIIEVLSNLHAFYSGHQ